MDVCPRFSVMSWRIARSSSLAEDLSFQDKSLIRMRQLA
jgi:hypothetical protein